MARPRKDDSTKRGTVVSYRLSPEEFALMKALAERTGQSLAELSRRQALAAVSAPILNRPTRPVNQPAKARSQHTSPPDFARDPAAELSVETFQELRRIGVNLNQIARRMNASTHVDNAGLAVVNERLGEIFRMMEPRLPPSGEDAP